MLLHGFTQTGRLWGPFGDKLSTTRTIIGVDLPGHAGSDSVRADLATTAHLVREAIEATIGSAPCDLLGYSLGARVALHVATGTELALNTLIVIGATGGMEDPEQRSHRRQADEAIADDLEASGRVDSFIDGWLASPMFARLSDAADSGERKRNSAAGLASSLRMAGLGAQEPLWNRLTTLSVPMLSLAGTDDTRFSAHALRLARLAPHGVASLVPGGGHAVHLAQPDHVWRLIRHWLGAA
ncbi:MAG TPA: alpha/beta fold hydrolase [Acidimicrobiales bacterium]|nr:alpha/beta fold hydrolase [Acidimicrobiales bacterium]